MKRKRRIARKKATDFNSSSGPRECLNCGHEDAGHYCSNCGQSFIDVNRTGKEIFTDLLGLLSLDRTIFRTIVPFLFRPGFLAGEYLAGKRKTYLSPVRLYLFLSIVFFFIARIGAEKSIDPALNSNSIFLGDSSGIRVSTDSLLLSEGLPGDSLMSFRDALMSDTASAGKEENELKIRKSLVKALDNKSAYVSSLLNNISYGLFLLMPLFALILQMLYIRRKRYYVEHLIFSLNMHSFALLILSFVIAVRMMIPNGVEYINYLILIIPVYFVMGMKRFYRQGFLKIILKVTILGVLYMMILGFTLAGLVLLTIWRM